jgi:hypothetical protein
LGKKLPKGVHMFIFGKSSLDLVEPDWIFLIQLHELAKEFVCVLLPAGG